MPLCPHAYLFTCVCVDVVCQHIRTEALASFLCSVTSFMCSLQNTVIMFKINGCSLALSVNVEAGKDQVLKRLLWEEILLTVCGQEFTLYDTTMPGSPDIHTWDLVCWRSERQSRVHFIVRKLEKNVCKMLGFLVFPFGFSISCVSLCLTWSPGMPIVGVSVKNSEVDEVWVRCRKHWRMNLSVLCCENGSVHMCTCSVFGT